MQGGKVVKTFKDKITLNKNGRGCYVLDTVKGCKVCGTTKPYGCYGNCYAFRIASRYKLEFTKTVDRNFEKDNEQLYLFDVSDQHHIGQIIHQIKNMDMPFYRIGEMGDPSYNWEHTIDICEKLYTNTKKTVIATKHWETIPDALLERISKLGLTINTSISALDTKQELRHRLFQYERLKKYCNSVLRVVTCDFNTTTIEGIEKDKLQIDLLSNERVIDTVFRTNKDNMYITTGLIHAEYVQFLGTKCLVSRKYKNTFIGYCKDCKEMCGINFIEKFKDVL